MNKLRLKEIQQPTNTYGSVWQSGFIGIHAIDGRRLKIISTESTPEQPFNEVQRVH
jgi:hypothetical protein